MALLKLCDYGCGKKAKYQFKNGKWCCSKSQNSCIYVKKKQCLLLKNKKKTKPIYINNDIIFCDYGCGKLAKFKFQNNKYCCEDNISKCENIISSLSENKLGVLNPHYGKKHTDEFKKKQSNRMKLERQNFNSKYNSEQYKEKQRQYRSNISSTDKWKKQCSNWMKKAWKNNNKLGSGDWVEKQKLSQKITIKKINKKYPFFSKIEEMRYNPNIPKEKEIQVRCKNHNCLNSKEHDGWFTPTYIQLYERIRQLENKNGNGGSYFYCSDECKNECPLFGLRYDPFKINNKRNYTQEEYQQFREFVLERDNYKCQYCGNKADHVHHERPQKLEPFFSLDPDYAWSCCSKCHYEKGHKEECSTGNLANKLC